MASELVSGREEFRHGWPIVAAAFVGIALGIASVPFYILGPLMKPLQSDFGWSLDGLMLSGSLVATGVTISSPLAGKLADRFDPRFLVAISLIMLAACYAAASQIRSELWHFQTLYFLMGFLGAGSSGIVLTRAIGARFDRARGLALGIALCGSGAANFAAPLFVHSIVETAGWQAVFLTLTGVTLFFALPVTFLGLGSGRSAAATGAARPREEAYGPTLREVMRDPRFYILMLSVALFGLPISSLILNMVPMLLAGGMDAGRAAATASVMGVMMIVARLMVGTLLDRARPSHVGMGIFLLGAAGAILLLVGGVDYAIVTVAMIGFLLGAEIDLMSFITLRYFGTRAYGQIFGIIYSTYTAISIVGPALGGAWIGMVGYEGLYVVAATTFLLVALLFLILSRMSDEKPLRAQV